MRDFVVEICKNKIFLSTLITWAVAQSIKILLCLFQGQRFNFKWVLGTGGMPSAHAAGVSALATSVGFQSGFDSPLFAVTSIFCLVTMFDAQGVRRSAGRQAGILNKIIDDIYLNKGIRDERLKELIGHTPIQVLVGGLLGIVMAVFCYNLWGDL
ncbi:MAG: divergent PAP2 family protein [Candidatus Omnitrophica bacterium]|nr:divergent PAP2 family protein [Candidatus Omnitrophota bacterium]